MVTRGAFRVLGSIPKEVGPVCNNEESRLELALVDLTRANSTKSSFGAGSEAQLNINSHAYVSHMNLPIGQNPQQSSPSLPSHSNQIVRSDTTSIDPLSCPDQVNTSLLDVPSTSTAGGRGGKLGRK